MAGLGVLFELAIFRPLRNTAPVAKLAASLGLLLVLQAGAIVVFGDTTKSAHSILPSRTLTIFGRVVPEDRFWLAGIVIVVAAVLAALYRWTPFGLSTRASSENEVSAMLAGLSPSRLAVVNTVLACVVAGGLGVLVAPLVTLDAQTLAFAVVRLAAALLAGFTSFFIACFAGLASAANSSTGRHRPGSRPTPRELRSTGYPSCSSSSSSFSRSSCEEQTSPAAESSSKGGSPPSPGPSAC
jgi:branched-chain amino acid transport system permease protein